MSSIPCSRQCLANGSMAKGAAPPSGSRTRPSARSISISTPGLASSQALVVASTSTGSKPFFRQLLKNICDLRTHHRLKTIIPQSPGGMLARGAAADIGARDENSATERLGRFNMKSGLGVPSAEAPVGEQMFARPVFVVVVDSARANPVGIDVRSGQDDRRDRISESVCIKPLGLIDKRRISRVTARADP